MYTNKIQICLFAFIFINSGTYTSDSDVYVQKFMKNIANNFLVHIPMNISVTIAICSKEKVIVFLVDSLLFGAHVLCLCIIYNTLTTYNKLT